MRLLKRVKDSKGQASIMVGMMMLTFILFFAFVINTGMLVNAKINLQNAADMAAYAGASVQARQLNQISYLNYEMRRQYKKFLFRYYVMGNMAQDPFPRASGSGTGTTPARWSPDGTVNYASPVVCMIFNSQDNFCHMATLPKIEIPPPNPLDAINATLIDQLKQIEQIRQNNCVSIGITNTTVLRLWLWNTDPDLVNLQNQMPSELQKSVNTIRGLAMGLGLIPRELFLRARIETLKNYVNEPPQTGVTYDRVSRMAGDQDPPATERTQQAFFSAFYTLGEHTFNSSDIVMDELTPTVLLQLKDIKAQFDSYAVSFTVNGGFKPSTTNAECLPVVEADTLQSPITLGVYKDIKTMTYYAVRLKAKAQVLFSPFGDMTLKAYSAAQPFGSRIGPPLEEADFVRTDVSTGSLPNPPGDNGFRLQHKIPNLAIREQNDSAATGKGWDTTEAIGSFYQGFKGPNGSAILSIDQTGIQYALQTAMAPNPFEGSKYNILNDLGDQFVRNFDSKGLHAFWAPVFPPSKASQADSEIQTLVRNMIGETRVGSQDFKAALTRELTSYIGKLRQGQGEAIGSARESFNIAYIEDSLHYSGSNPPKTIAVPGLVETNPKKLKTSWNAVLNGDFRKDGRVGYSVKFVSFASLQKHSSKTDGQSTWNNDMNIDEEANLDLSFIQH